MSEGQELWLLQKPNTYRTNLSDRIGKCIYRGYIGKANTVQLITKEGLLGITITIYDPKTSLFETLEELKDYLIKDKINEKSNLQKQIYNIDSDINYIQSLRDVKEDREKIINSLFNNQDGLE